MTEWLKVPVLKTGVGIPYRGFESHSLRHVMLTRTLGSRCVTEGILYFIKPLYSPDLKSSLSSFFILFFYHSYPMEYALSSTLCYTKHMQPSQFDQPSSSDAADTSRTARAETQATDEPNPPLEIRRGPSEANSNSSQVSPFPDPTEPLLIWQEREVNDTTRPRGWYVIFGVVVVVLFAISIFLFKSYTFALLIPIMAVALIVSLPRPAALLNYSASHTEVVVGQRTYSYDTFRSFSVTAKPTQNWITLIPRKRFAMPIVMYFPEDVGEQLVDLIASHLPMSERKPDLLERLIIYLRLQ